jgi:hypothetical protein
MRGRELGVDGSEVVLDSLVLGVVLTSNSERFPGIVSTIQRLHLF